MYSLKVLRQDDLTHIEARLKFTLKTSSVTLERGYLLQSEAYSFSYLIIRDARGKKYKVDAVAEKFKRYGEDERLPSAVLDIKEYDRNFAFKDKR